MILQPTHTCFDDALDYLESLALCGTSTLILLEHKLVHGVVLNPDGDREYAHAWVEHRDEAIGGALLHGVRVYYFTPRREFYRAFRPQMMTKYSVVEAWHENKRTGHYGPWEDYYRTLAKENRHDQI